MVIFAELAIANRRTQSHLRCQTMVEIIPRKPQKAIGATPGQALDNIEQQLNEAGILRDSATAIILHRTQGDRFFPTREREKLQDLMTRFHETSATGNTLSDRDRTHISTPKSDRPQQ